MPTFINKYKTFFFLLYILLFFETQKAKFILKERYIKFSSGIKKYIHLYRSVRGLCDIVIAEDVSNKL